MAMTNVQKNTAYTPDFSSQHNQDALPGRLGSIQPVMNHVPQSMSASTSDVPVDLRSPQVQVKKITVLKNMINISLDKIKTSFTGHDSFKSGVKAFINKHMLAIITGAIFGFFAGASVAGTVGGIFGAGIGALPSAIIGSVVGAAAGAVAGALGSAIIHGLMELPKIHQQAYQAAVDAETVSRQ